MFPYFLYMCFLFKFLIFDHWGEPERAPHRSVVDVGGMSVACLTIYGTYTAVGWWCERHMLDNLHYKYGVWLVVRPTIYFTNMEATVSWTNSRGVKVMASNEEILRRRMERDRLRKQTETLIICFSSIQEKTFPQKHLNPTELEGSDIVTLLLSILAQRALASCTCAMHQYSKCCSLQLRVFTVILSSWSLLAKTLYTCGL